MNPHAQQSQCHLRTLGSALTLAAPMEFPRKLDDAFVADAPYGPGGMLLDELLAVDRTKSMVRVSMPTHSELPLTREQRAHPHFHPRHISGGLMVHMAGMVGFVHAYYVMDLRHADGWIGYGGRIYTARFLSLATPGAPMILEGTATKTRKGDRRCFVRYTFRFQQEGRPVYESEQSAMWMRMEGR